MIFDTRLLFRFRNWLDVTLQAVRYFHTHRVDSLAQKTERVTAYLFCRAPRCASIRCKCSDRVRNRRILFRSRPAGWTLAHPAPLPPLLHPAPPTPHSDSCPEAPSDGLRKKLLCWEVRPRYTCRTRNEKARSYPAVHATLTSNEAKNKALRSVFLFPRVFTAN